MEQVLTLLEFQPVHRSGVQWYGVCPLHGSASGRSRWFSVNVASGRYYCHGCRSHGKYPDLLGPPPPTCRSIRLPSTYAIGLVATCPGFGAGESLRYGHGGKPTHPEA
jgi:hypothetical protein